MENIAATTTQVTTRDTTQVEQNETSFPVNMTPKERLFSVFYLKTMNIRATSDATNLSVQICRHILKRTHVANYIFEKLRDLAMTALEAEVGVSNLSRASIEDFIDIDDSGFPRLNFLKAKESGALGSVKSLKYDSEGRPEIVLYDRLRALELMMRRHGLLVDQVAVKGSVDVNVAIVKETMAGAMADPGRLLAMIELAERLRITSAKLPAT